MKKLFLFLLLTTALISCSDSNDTPPVNITKTDIIGTWNLTTLDNIATVSGSVAGQSFKNTGKAYGKDFDATLTFSDTKVITNGKYTLVVEANGATQEQLITSNNDEKNWDLKDGNIIQLPINLDATGLGIKLNSLDFTITSHTTTKMVLKAEPQFKFNGFDVTQNYTMVLEK